MQKWGFEYKTNLVWVKDKIGTGYYLRGQHELLLIGIKGKIGVPNEADRVSSVLIAPRNEHSQKPQEVYNIIEKMYPNCKYIELFARNKHEGWESWGNEL
jgi:N6-adenosine-specific RNA methylase IME4